MWDVFSLGHFFSKIFYFGVLFAIGYFKMGYFSFTFINLDLIDSLFQQRGSTSAGEQDDGVQPGDCFRAHARRNAAPPAD